MTARPFPETCNNSADGQDANRKIAPLTGSGSGSGWPFRKVSRRTGTKSKWPVADPNTEPLAARIGELAHALAIDIRDPGSVANGLGRNEARFGRLALLINNASAREQGQIPFGDVDVETCQRDVATNLSGALYCVRGVVRLMKAPISARRSRPDCSPP